ncbi:hypothetical protein MA16_Dca003395 [Dendrobium catenatum]|uniref:Transposase MuDR plant domain-containing protein n=1 Tax=Dendrobium catenatum TaxID=906689 RepID=A0A2I0XCP4_9ASPA|nr:hypothetical protein MA16_Dca003395 [Dendrobium catenatum]
MNLFMLKTEILKICQWLKGYKYSMHYHIHKTSPKEYKIINTDVDVTEMVKVSSENFRAKLVISVEEVDREQSNTNLMGVVSAEYMAECYVIHNGCISSVHNTSAIDIGIDTFFNDAKSFKNALRSVAIKENFGVRIKASDKKRVIATCSYQGCEWRIRASLCEDTQSFQVRRLDGVHTCPGINRAGNRLATSAWVANEIQEMVKRYPDIPPKEINSSLEKEYGLSLPYMKLWRAREEARDALFGSVDDNYKWVPTLATELLHMHIITADLSYCLWCRYKLAYEGAIFTLPGKDLWQVAENTEHVGVPSTCRQEEDLGKKDC